jgi:SpoVK/Ycf46/Vps4 family AAA+-type ATPase
MRELHGLISIHRVKAQIEEMVRLVRYYRESNRDVLNAFFLHTVLIGNPGTGKTTVARILAKIYKALGILERGHLVETDRQGLVAGHIGGTALKTAERVDESLGGVLFIDEAYALTQRQQGGTDEYGAEAIQTLLKRMEDKRGKFFVFVAGYPENMEAFLKANPGLSSRFDKILRFDDYTPDELYTIAVDILQAENLSPNEEAAQYLRSHFQYLFDTRDKYFGNARTVRSLMLDLVKKFYLRRAGMSPEEREQAGENTLLLADVLSLGAESESIQVKRPSIGFRREQ